MFPLNYIIKSNGYDFAIFKIAINVEKIHKYI